MSNPPPTSTVGPEVADASQRISLDDNPSSSPLGLSILLCSSSSSCRRASSISLDNSLTLSLLSSAFTPVRIIPTIRTGHHQQHPNKLAGKGKNLASSLILRRTRMLVFYPLLSFLHELHDPHQSDSVDQVFIL
mmetsp:Transcript_6096/g.21582  ORF Transcript_6096/g.21582 Transcript_6096/m.21582 type:complete len:134 (+) Transcript_6096:1230-1631(+)